MAIYKETREWWIDDESGLRFRFEPVDSDDIILVRAEDDGYKMGYVTRDENPDSPDEVGDEDLFLVFYHRQFRVKRDCVSESLLRAYADVWPNIPEKPKEGEDDLDDVRNLAEKYHVFFLSAYIHSGVSLRLWNGQSGWDLSTMGAVLVTKSETTDTGKAEELAKSLVEEWNQYLRGDMYCVVVEKIDKDKNPVDYEILEGIYGLDDAIADLKFVMNSAEVTE